MFFCLFQPSKSGVGGGTVHEAAVAFPGIVGQESAGQSLVAGGSW